MTRIGEHAVVIGASVAGLLAARALADFYEQVTVIERDVLPVGPEGRKAVPQGRHAHALLPHGQACIDALLPGFSAELAGAGAPTCAAMEEMRFIIGGHQLARASMGSTTILASRPFIEGHLRRRVRELAQVTLIDECDALGVTTRGDDRRVTGVRIRHHGDGNPDEVLATDLVVAATGRSARVPAWLAALGYPTPEQERLDISVSYASQRLSLSADSLSGDKLVLIGARPGHPRALFLFAEEGDRWILGLAGYGPEHQPPADPDGFAAFAASVAPADVLEAIQTAQPLAEIATHGFPASLRRRYDRLQSFPAGLLVIGDAISSFNPTYGQGMTVAATEAVALRDCLAHGTPDLAGRFFSAARGPIDDAWELSVGADLALPEVKARRPARVRLTNAYLRRLRATAEHDPAVAAAFIAVVGMLERPPHVLRPAIAWRVARGPVARSIPTTVADRRHGTRRPNNPPDHMSTRPNQVRLAASARPQTPPNRRQDQTRTQRPQRKAETAEAAPINPAATIPPPNAEDPATALSEDANPTMPHGIPDAMSIQPATSATVRNREHSTTWPPAHDLNELTPREHEILTLVAHGLRDRGIGSRLCLTRKTVETHIRHVLTKLDLPSDGEHNWRVLAAMVYLTITTTAAFDPPVAPA